MKKSQFCAALKDGSFRATGGERVSFSDPGVRKALQLAELAGVTWDPEDPEVLWQKGRIRLLVAGEWQLCSAPEMTDEGAWEGFTPSGAARSVYDELGRRLLEEHKQQEALDDHNDKQEGLRQVAPAIEVADPEKWHSFIGDHQDRLGNLDRRLTRVEEDLLLVRGQAAHVDEREAADFEATRIHLDGLAERTAALEARPAQVAMHYAEWKKLVAVYELWGEDGELRKKLANIPEGNLINIDFRQLRSELLALPVEEFPL